MPVLRISRITCNAYWNTISLKTFFQKIINNLFKKKQKKLMFTACLFIWQWHWLNFTSKFLDENNPRSNEWAGVYYQVKNLEGKKTVQKYTNDSLNVISDS